MDETCLQLAREGRLIEAQAATIGDFAVAKTDVGVTMTRTGRRLTQAEGAQLWGRVQKSEAIRSAIGGHASGSVYKCPEIGDGSCFRFHLWVCQTDLATVAKTLTDAAAAIGVPDAELGVLVTLNERSGPRCKDRNTCAPSVHYSTPQGRYDPALPRKLGGRGTGRCTGDGDCNASNHCQAWYLGGGVELAIYQQYFEPIWCGCMEGTCNWFSQ